MKKNFGIIKLLRYHFLGEKVVVIFLLVIVITEIFTIFMSYPKKSEADITKSDTYKVCLEIQNSGKRLQCWESLIDSVLNKDGLDQTFNLVSNLYENDPQFATNCHSFSHKIGEFAYEEFAKNKQIKLTQKTSYCGYGFYHGFMEKLLLTTKDLQMARDFCDYADQELSKQTIDAKGACYHGIGHGAVDGEDPRYDGDAIATVKLGLNLCEKVSINPDQLFRCSSGAFNALEILMSQGRSGLGLSAKDPFWVCRDQPEKYKRSCYTQMVVAAKNVARQDFIKTAEFIDTIVEDVYAVESLETLAVEKINARTKSYTDMLDFCKGLEQRFRLACVKAYGEGFLKYGPPNNEHVEALKFCQYELLSDIEHEKCFSRVLELLRNFYTKEKSEEICRSVEKKYWLNDCIYRF